MWKLLLDNPAKSLNGFIRNRQIRPSCPVGRHQKRRGGGHGLADDSVQVAAAVQDLGSLHKAVHPLLPVLRQIPVLMLHLLVPLNHIARIEVHEPRVDSSRAEHSVGHKGVLARKVAELWRVLHECEKLWEISSDVLGADQIRDRLLEERVIRSSLVVMHARRVVVNQREPFRHGLTNIFPEGAIRLWSHRHKKGMADVSAQNSALARITEPIKHSARVAPCNAHLSRHTEPLGFIREHVRDTFEFVEFDRIELPIAIGGVDAMHASGVQAPHVLAEDALVESIVVIEWCRNRSPDAMKIFAGQAFVHWGDLAHYCPLEFGGTASPQNLRLSKPYDFSGSKTARPRRARRHPPPSRRAPARCSAPLKYP